MPEVALIHYTGRGTDHPQLYAAQLLAFTKNTRLQMTPDGFDSFAKMPMDDLLDEMKYMAGTIPSSWEFVDVVFAVNGISRATAQQMTRTRTASFAMQSQRVTDMSDVDYNFPPEWADGSPLHDEYSNVMCEAVAGYHRLVRDGAKLEDARGVLPVGVNCNLIAKYNLRAFVDLVRARDSLRVQGEYVDVVRQMKEWVISIWPWSETFFEPKDAKAIAMIEEVALWLRQTQRTSDVEPSTKLAKAADLLKK